MPMRFLHPAGHTVSAAESVATFTAELLNFSALVKEEAQIAVGELGLFAWKKLVEFTPVLSGRARYSWNFSYGDIDTTVPAEGSYSVPPVPTLNTNPTEFEPVFVSSHLDYMEALENGHSKKGEHMMEKTMHLVDLQLETIIGGRENV